MANAQPQGGDTFVNLLDSMPRIADAVNSFTSPDVQRSAFDALVLALGLSNGPQTPLLAARRPSPPKPAVETGPGQVETAVSDPEPSPGQPNGDVSNKRRRAGRAGLKKSFTITRGLNFEPKGKQSLEAFITEKSPSKQDEMNLIACLYLRDMIGIAAITVGDVLAVYQAADWQAAAHPDVSLRKTASATGWIDTSDSKNIKVAWKGENHVKSKMPIKKAA